MGRYPPVKCWAMLSAALFHEDRLCVALVNHPGVAMRWARRTAEGHSAA